MTELAATPRASKGLRADRLILSAALLAFAAALLGIQLILGNGDGALLGPDAQMLIGP